MQHQFGVVPLPTKAKEEDMRPTLILPLVILLATLLLSFRADAEHIVAGERAFPSVLCSLEAVVAILTAATVGETEADAMFRQTISTGTCVQGRFIAVAERIEFTTQDYLGRDINVWELSNPQNADTPHVYTWEVVKQHTPSLQSKNNTPTLFKLLQTL